MRPKMAMPMARTSGPALLPSSNSLSTLIWQPQPVRDLNPLADQLQRRAAGLKFQQRREVLLAVTQAGQGHHQLLNQAGQGQGNAQIVCRGQAQVEVLTQEAGGEGGPVVGVDQLGCLVA